MDKPLILKEYTNYGKGDKKPDYSNYTNEEIYNLCSEVDDYISINSSNIININGETGRLPSMFEINKQNQSVKVRGYVGVINANIEVEETIKDLTINIGSRFDAGKQQYFLNYIFSKVFNVNGKIFEDMEPNVDSNVNWDILFAMVFIKYLNETKSTGLYRKYQTFEYNDSKLKGRIDISRHIKFNMIDNGKVAYSTREYTVNNNINHLILLANDQLEKKYNQIYRNILNGKPEARKIIDELKSKIPDYKTADARKILRETARPITHPYYNRFENLRKISIMILRRLGYNVFQDTGARVVGIVIDMASLWETFLEETIFKGLRFGDDLYFANIQDENGILQERKNGSQKKFMRKIKPDFTVRDNGENREYKAVFDAKYRDAWGKNVFQTGDSSWDSGIREDVFQVMAYMLALNCDVGGVVFPVNDDKAEESDMTEGYIISKYCENRTFYVVPYVVPMYGTGLDVEIGLSYEEFSDNMNKQSQTIRGKIASIITNEK